MARILIIEDNTANRELMTYLLQAFGHTTTECADGTAGLASLQLADPDLVICDVHLPGVDGYEVARRVRQGPQTSPYRLVAVTALAMAGDSEKALAVGFDGYISKPIDPYAFVAQIEAYLPPELRLSPAPAPPVAAARPAEASVCGRRATILAVDDSMTNREVLRSTLAPCGYTVIGVGSVKGALTVAKRAPPDLIISDLRMPDQDGFAMVRLLREDPALRAIPCIVLTASVWNEGDRRRVLELGADRFLQQPVAPAELVAAVEACVASRGRP